MPQHRPPWEYLPAAAAEAEFGEEEDDDSEERGSPSRAAERGRVLAGPARDGEAILTADLDLDEIVRGAFDLDVVGHYARPDVFRLLVDHRRLAPVIWETERL
jgi:nitrilase